MVTAAALSGGSAAVAADLPDPVLLLPGGNARAMLVDDGTLYAWDWAPGASGIPVYTRAIETTDTGTTLGAAQFAFRMAPESGPAAHEGTVAYVRATDERLVFRYPDGTERVPAWAADDPTFRAGASDLSAEWLVAGETWYGPGAYRRTDGLRLDLEGLSVAPSEGGDPYVQRVVISDDRVLWTAAGSLGDLGRYTRVYTAPLSGTGITGPAVLVTEATYDVSDPSNGVDGDVHALAINGESVIWDYVVSNAVADVWHVRWYDAAPYTGEPNDMELEEGRYVYDVAGGTVTTGKFSFEPGTYAYEVRDLSAPDIVRFAMTTPADTTSVDGTLVAYSQDAAAPTWVVDLRGLPITADDTPTTQPPAFSDVRPGEPFAAEILWLADHGITTGYADGSFRRSASVNRDAMAAFLFRLAYPGLDTTDCPAAVFDDVPATHPFCAEISWLSETAITTGWPDGTFRPAQAVTREAMSAFLYRYANDGADAPACTSAPFADVLVTDPFCGEIAWLADQGISTGWADNTFRPGATIERQAIAAFLFRFASLD